MPRSTLVTSPPIHPPSLTWKMTTATPTTHASTTSASRPHLRLLSVAHPPRGPFSIMPPPRSWTGSTPRSTSPGRPLHSRTSTNHRQTGERGRGRAFIIIQLLLALLTSQLLSCNMCLFFINACAAFASAALRRYTHGGVCRCVHTRSRSMA